MALPTGPKCSCNPDSSILTSGLPLEVKGLLSQPVEESSLLCVTPVLMGSVLQSRQRCVPHDSQPTCLSSAFSMWPLCPGVSLGGKLKRNLSCTGQERSTEL